MNIIAYSRGNQFYDYYKSNDMNKLTKGVFGNIKLKLHHIPFSKGTPTYKDIVKYYKLDNDIAQGRMLNRMQSSRKLRSSMKRSSSGKIV